MLCAALRRYGERLWSEHADLELRALLSVIENDYNAPVKGGSMIAPKLIRLSLMCAALSSTRLAKADDVWDRVEHRFATHDGVKLHYAALGRGPLVVMLHGFPDFWYTWRHPMAALSDRYRIAAVDLRGYNQSDKPAGVENYAMPLLRGDVAAVIAAEQRSSAVIVGHDWGGAIAWSVAAYRPELVDLLVILNLPHPHGLQRERRTNPQQRRNSAYAYNFQKPDAHRQLTAEQLSELVVADPAAKAHYLTALRNSNFESMLNYYKANYPKPGSPPRPAMPKVKAPVLMFHGLDDQALLPGALNGTWQWLEKDLTLVTIPNAGHNVQTDAAELVTQTLTDWLARRVKR
jgi:epoxide hydrolase 4